ncbi:MAG: ParM/StbA family protein [Pyrinomonadaceae bacterium]|jgi:hypothetical protein|nr:ParM/StbA family protein [Pyrinomonadaceae bacterium]
MATRKQTEATIERNPAAGERSGVVGIDTGYSAVKIYSEANGAARTLIFPSVTGDAQFAEDFLGTPEQADFIAELSIEPGVVRNVGETAVRLNRGGETTTDREEFTRSYNPALSLAGLARFLHEKKLPVPDTIVVGLPVNFFAAYRQAMAASLTGDHRVTLYRRDHSVRAVVEFSIENVLVLPQGYGSYLSWALDAGGEKIPDRLRPTAVIDGGEKTIDIACAEGRYVDEYSKSIPSSLDAVYHNMQREIDSRFDDFLSRSEIESYIRSNQPYVAGNGTQVDLAEMRVEILRRLAPEIINRIQETIRPMRPVHILVAGGSGELLYEPLKRTYPQAEIIKPAVFSNAIGFYKYGLLRQGQQTAAKA